MPPEKLMSYETNFADYRRRVGSERAFKSTPLQVSFGGRITRMFEYADEQDRKINRGKTVFSMPLNTATEGS